MSRKKDSSLEPPETTDADKIVLSYRARLLNHQEAELEKVRLVYDTIETRNTFTKVEKLGECSTHAYFASHKETGEVRVFSSKCRLRWCPICAKSKQRYVTMNVEQWVKEVAHPKFMTLTIRHSNAPLRHQIDSLYHAFQKLRKLRDFKDLVFGGIWFFQIHVGKSDGLWHPHLHCLVDGKYVPQGILSDLWKSCTDGSRIVDIRAVKDEKKIAEYVARYSARPSLLHSLPDVNAVELVQSLHGRRLCGSWGTAADVKLGQPVCTDKEQWKNVGSFSFVVNLCETDARAKAICKAWKTGKPLNSDIDMSLFEDKAFGRFFAKIKAPPDPYIPGFFDLPKL